MIQLSAAVRNARLDAIETAIGTSARLKIFSGVQPPDTTYADDGTMLATLVLPSDWMSAAAAGVKALLGTWSVAAAASGVANYFRLYNSGVSVCHMQGWVSDGTFPGELVLSNVNITIGDTVTVTAFSLTDGNA